MTNHFRLAVIAVSFIGLFASCKKTDTPAPATPTPVAAPTPVSANVIKDSVVTITRDLYLWYNQIPVSFNAQTYADPAAIMTAIQPYSTEPGFSKPVDRWSFGMKKTDWDNLSGGMSSASGATNAAGDFGLTVFFKAEGDLRVRLVERASPAGAAGIERSWRITKINNNTDITTGNATFIVDAVYNSASSTFTFIKPDGSTVDITLSAAHYKTQPVYLDSIYTINNKKIGYLVFNSFIGDTTQINSDFQRVFNKFSAANISDLVVDLRYNGGGYVSVQEALADYISPQSVNGSLMFKENYNDKNSQYNQSTYFHKKGALNMNRVYFIVTKNTASASELLINNLTPVMDVKLIGPSTTHGKPVGFFPVPVGDWYVFPVSFRSTNKNGTGNYFNGIPVTNSVADGLDKNWGDILESSLASALKHITTGTFVREGGMISQDPMIISGNNKLSENEFNGMISGTKRK